MAKTILERLLGYEAYDEGRDPLDTGFGNIEPKRQGAAEFGKGLLDMGGQAARGTAAGAIALPHDISTIGTALWQLQDDLPDRDKMNWWEAFGTRMANAEAAQPDWLPSYQDADQALPEFTPMSETFADYSEGNRPIETFSSMAFAPAPYVKAYQGLKAIPNPLREGGALNPKRVEGVVESPRIRLLEQMDEQQQLPPTQPKLRFIADPEPPAARQQWYHASPYEFTELDAARLGTGEGGADTALGFSFSRRPATAEGYLEDFPTINPETFKNVHGMTMAEAQARADALVKQYAIEEGISVDDALAWGKHPKSIDGIKAKFKSETAREYQEVNKLLNPYTYQDGYKGIKSSEWLNKNKTGYVMSAELPDMQHMKIVDMGGDAYDEARHAVIGKEAKAEGYKGVIFKNVVDDALSGSGRDDIALVFDTGDAKIIKSRPVGQAQFVPEPEIPEGALSASTFVQPEAIRLFAESGGSPAPSIGIARADSAPDVLGQFGDVQLLVNPDRIRQGNYRIYGDDAYLGRAPEVSDSYEVMDVALAMANDPEYARYSKEIPMFIEDFIKLDTDGIVGGKERYRQMALGKAVKIIQQAADFDRPLPNPAQAVIDYDPKDFYRVPGLRDVNAESRFVEMETGLPYDADAALDQMMGRDAQVRGAEFEGDLTLTPKQNLFAREFKDLDEAAAERHLLRNRSERKFPKNDMLAVEFDDLMLDISRKFFDELFDKGPAHQGARDIMEGRNIDQLMQKYNMKPEDIKTIKDKITNLQDRYRFDRKNYFEAKGDEVIKLEDFDAVVIDEMYTDAIKILEDAGVKKILTYGTPKERAEIFKKYPELLFSLMLVGFTGPALMQEQEQGDGS